MPDVIKRLNEKEILCIICPNSCRLAVFEDENGEIHVENNQCKRGEQFGRQEYIEPLRTLITTMKIKKGTLPVIPVRSNKEIPKAKIFEAMDIVNKMHAIAPVKMGDILIENLLDLGVNVIASRSMEEISHIKVPTKDVKEITCIICPNSCQLKVYRDKLGEIHVEGNKCKRGFEYGTQEFIMPKRTLITTMKIKNGFLPVIPVRSDAEIPKSKMFDAMEEVNKATAQAPIKAGDVIIPNLLGLGVNVISSRSMSKAVES